MGLKAVSDDRTSFSSVGSRFHARGDGAATENARLLICHSIRGRKRSAFLEACSDERVGMLATDVSRSVM